MSFAAPLWLLAMLPWGAVAAWLTWGRRPRVDVPFLNLWRGIKGERRAKRSWEWPPAAVVLAMLGALVAIIGAGRPVVPWPLAGPLVTVVVDRGITMTADGGGRYRRAVDRAGKELLAFGLGPVDLMFVPGQGAVRTDRSDWTSHALRRPPIAVDTSNDLTQTVRRVLAAAEGPVAVISDRDPNIRDERLITIPQPDGPIENVGIVAVAARDAPSPEVMLRIRNESAASRAALRVTSAGRERRQDLQLPPRGGEQNYFVPLEGAGDVVEAEVTAAGDRMAVDDRAWLVRESRWPRLEPRFDPPPALRRMIDVYANRRPAGEGSKIIAVGEREGDVIVSPSLGGAALAGDPRVVDHPVTRGIDWAGVVREARVGSPPAGDWKSLVSAGGTVLVALQEEPARRVWIGFDSAAWERMPDYVVFWTNVFDWVGQTGEQFASHGPERLSPQWRPETPIPAGVENGLWPGIYRRSDGVRRAVNAPRVDLPSLPNTDWEGKLKSIARKWRGGIELGPPLDLLAVALLALSAGVWKRKSRAVRRFRPAEVPVAAGVRRDEP